MATMWVLFRPIVQLPSSVLSITLRFMSRMLVPKAMSLLDSPPRVSICADNLAGKQTVLDIMGMMDCFIVDKEKERRLAQLIPLVIQSVVELTMVHRSSFSRTLQEYVYVLDARKNGQVVGTVEKDVKGRLYPTIAVHSQHEEVSVNFGKDPFLFDIKAYEAAQRAKQQTYIERISIPQTASYGIVRSYLQHYGYEDTLHVFDVASQSSVPPITGIHDNGFNEHGVYALKHRKILRKLIKDGQIDDAFGNLREWYPQTVQDDTSAICLMLHCQKFIELVRVGHLEEAVDYGRTHFEKFYSLKEYEDLVKDCAALLAYEEPKKSSVGYLLEESQLENVADAVNAIILSTNPEVKDNRSCLHSYLEKLLRQLTACFLEKRLLNGNQGEAFHLRRVLLAKNS
ncbi:ran-binding protein M homolog isoform X3 [Cynara cardunculus var. scolymus]|uniref:ran-binding protein M homolog isoform X3 n=1 Tax=Cynara cardunculus var. scolymus TaxID=59895 RepID=UPI000D629ADA|nr:ran-binding protein M homolog isoform X3 [Cynara cardunculus var. scolymus]